MVLGLCLSAVPDRAVASTCCKVCRKGKACGNSCISRDKSCRRPSDRSPPHRTHTLLGAPAPEIRNLASEIGADAIVMGSHGHSGWKILLGSTAIKVLHGATCDVLTVHVGNS